MTRLARTVEPSWSYPAHWKRLDLLGFSLAVEGRVA
jgi:hypothetical protein